MFNRSTRRPSASEARKAREDRLGVALILAVTLAFAGMMYGAIQLDAARGISVSQSLDSAGL